MRIGILECGPTHPEVAATLGTYPQMFTRLFGGRGWDFAVWSVKDMDFPAGPEAADGWILTGSRHGVYEDHGFIPPLEAFIRAAVEAGRPMLGICFGHQIIAQAMGGRVEKATAGWNIGRHVYDVDGLGRVALTAWHQDQVTEVPDGAEVVASSAFCPAAALRYGDRALTLQAHPEFGHDVTEAFLGLVAGDPAYPGALLDQARDGLARPLDTTPVVDWLADFLSAAAAAETRSRRHG